MVAHREDIVVTPFEQEKFEKMLDATLTRRLKNYHDRILQESLELQNEVNLFRSEGMKHAADKRQPRLAALGIVSGLLRDLMDEIPF